MNHLPPITPEGTWTQPAKHGRVLEYLTLDGRRVQVRLWTFAEGEIEGKPVELPCRMTDEEVPGLIMGALERVPGVKVKWKDAEGKAESGKQKVEMGSGGVDPQVVDLIFQERVRPWLLECFGEVISRDVIERNHRFLEEALELVQSCGCTQSEAHQLVDYVFGRPVGEPSQEAGGVMVTLAALCLANGLDMHVAAETELARIWTKVDAIRAKQAAKPKHSPLPIAANEGGALGATCPTQKSDASQWVSNIRRVLFLDVDGVLNTRPGSLDEEMLKWLQSLLIMSQAGVVVSSSWRTVPEQYERLLKALAGIGIVPIGCTPDLTVKKGNLHLSKDRWQEIEAWLKPRPQVDQFVILDDLPSMGPLSAHHVRTFPEFGLTQLQVMDALVLFDQQAQAKGDRGPWMPALAGKEAA